MSDPSIADTAGAAVAVPAGSAPAAAATPPAQPAPAAATGAASSLGTCKLYAASAIGAFLLGLTDYVRHGTKSTVVALNDGLAALDPRINLILVILLMTPVMGLIAAWIFKPTTERDAFALGFAVFSLFALVPEQEPKGEVEEISVSSQSTDVSFRLIAPAIAGQLSAGPPSSADVVLHFEGKPPPHTEVLVTNLTKHRRLGTFNIQDRLTLNGEVGDRIELRFEAPGYERARFRLTLDAFPGAHDVLLEKNRTPLFIQRLGSAAELQSMPRAIETMSGAQ